MIEGDINERMAQFAPSQNMDPALDVIRQRRGLLPPSTVAPSVAEMPEVAPQAEPDPIVDMLLERRKDRLNATLYGAMRVDPDQAARAQKLAPDVGVGPDMVMRHLPDMERQAKIADIERRRLYMNDPVLSNFLEQKEFAEVAHDDVGTLSKVKGIIGGIAAIPQSVSEGFRRGIATYELADLLDRQRQRGGSVDVIEKAAIESINEEIAALGRESGFWESAANIVTLNLAQAPEYVEPIVTGGVVGGAAGATLGLGGGPLAPATVPAGMATESCWGSSLEQSQGRLNRPGGWRRHCSTGRRWRRDWITTPPTRWRSQAAQCPASWSWSASASPARHIRWRSSRSSGAA